MHASAIFHESGRYGIARLHRTSATFYLQLELSSTLWKRHELEPSS